MSATILSDAVPVPSDSQPPAPTMTASAAAPEATPALPSSVEFAKCECCGLTEECTPAYISRVRDRYGGRWVCGLCAEAVKDESSRSGRLISTEEALNRHVAFCRKFRSSTPPANPTEHLISAVRQLLRRSLDSPRALRSTPASPRRSPGEEATRRRSLSRSGSCFPTLAS